MSTSQSSEQNLVNQCQLTGFASFKERLAYCCCRILKKSSSYNPNSVESKSEENLSQSNESKEKKSNEKRMEKQKIERQKKLDLIAKTLPASTTPRTITTEQPVRKIPGPTPTKSTTINRSVPTSKMSRQPSTSSGQTLFIEFLLR